ncbi:PREDICTED: serine/threonine-protein kinase MARK2-like [Hipposideros armiger]|uniref:non-specific serine/threonine protein kinase n=1 Tax=Hipposideros armiger TaxID=186990 RepID=A0A8B7S5G7_HIPAR|nr:PREDICTED: serine/threonine-protein kinase MARK2-like [Hipposideros armiger]
MNAKIGDFGFGTEFGDSKLATMCCSPSYAAPELFLGEDYEGPAVDVWSLGVTLFRMVAGRLPFKAQDCKKLGQQVIKGKYTVPYFFSFELEAFLKKMLRVKPEERRDLIDIMSDSWLNQDEEEDQMLYNEPPKENLDPWVKKEMKKLGFCYDDIQDALRNKTFNNVMAAYLILDAQKPKSHWRTIRVKPYNSTDQNPAPARELQSCSSSQQTEQHQDNYELGQEGKKSAAPAARQQLWTTTPGSSPESSPEPRAIRPWWRSPKSIAGLQSSTSEDFLTANYGSSSSSSSYNRSGSSGVTCHRFQRLARRCCNCITKLWRRLSRKNKVHPL